MKRLFGIATALFIAASASASAQSSLETKTIELRQLKPAEAVRLLRPYIVSPQGMVSEVADRLPIVTIKDSASNMAVIERVLAKYDRSPATIRLVYQLIEADTGPRLLSASNTREQVPVDLDSTLRSVLKFPAYRLLAEGIATVGELTEASQQMGDAGEGMVFKLLTRIGAVRTGDAPGTVNLDVQLWREGIQFSGNQSPARDWVISTKVDVPFGNTVVLGTAAARITSRSVPGSPPTTRGVALILAVRPELVPPGK